MTFPATHLVRAAFLYPRDLVWAAAYEKFIAVERVEVALGLAYVHFEDGWPELFDCHDLFEVPLNRAAAQEWNAAAMNQAEA